MTTPSERTRAVLETRQLLEGLCSPAQSERVAPELREAACRLLRHYPVAGDLRLVAQALPLCWSHPTPQKSHADT